MTSFISRLTRFQRFRAEPPRRKERKTRKHFAALRLCARFFFRKCQRLLSFCERCQNSAIIFLTGDGHSFILLLSQAMVIVNKLRNPVIADIFRIRGEKRILKLPYSQVKLGIFPRTEAVCFELSEIWL